VGIATIFTGPKKTVPVKKAPGVAQAKQKRRGQGMPRKEDYSGRKAKMPKGDRKDAW